MSCDFTYRFTRWRRPAAVVAVASMLALIASCATTKVVGTNIQRVADGQPVDRQALSQAVASDTKDMETNLQILHDALRTHLPFEETRVYVVKVAGYRKLFVAAGPQPVTAMQ